MKNSYIFIILVLGAIKIGCSSLRRENYQADEFSNLLHRDEELSQNSQGDLKRIIKALVQLNTDLD